MKAIADAIFEVEKAVGSIAKAAALRRNENVPGFKAVLNFIYNPYLKTGIGEASLNKAMKFYEGAPGRRDITRVDIMAYLTGNNTGSDFDLAVSAGFVAQVQERTGDAYAVKIAKALVTQNLQIGVTATTLNKVWGASFIPKTGCMLGTLLTAIPEHKRKWPMIMTEKLDGHRRYIVVNSTGSITAYTRSGLVDNGLVEIIPEMSLLPKGFVYDGELIAIGVFKDAIAQRQATASIANQKGPKHGLTFNAFDMVAEEAYMSGAGGATCRERKIRLGATLMDDSIRLLTPEWARLISAYGIHRELTYVKPVPILGVPRNLAEVEPVVGEIWKRGYEGVMLNTPDGLYKANARSKDLLKVKKTDEYVLTVTGVQEGRNKNEGKLGALVVNYMGSSVGVGTGFTDEQRVTLWDNQDAVIGRQIEVESFGESTNAQGTVSLNCPVFLRFVDEVHE